MAFRIVDQVVGNQAIATTDTTQRHPLGMRVRAIDATYGGGEFIYLSGVASTAVGSWVTYNTDDHSTALLVADAVGPVAVAMSANVASQYGWYQIAGKAVGKALAGYADNADVYATATAGSVDDAVVVGDLVYGARGASAVSGGVSDFEIEHPYVNNGEVFDSTAQTASTAEVNILTTVTATAAELNYLDITTLGTGAASKAVVLDGSSNYTTPGAGTWTFASGSALTAASGSTVNLAGTFQIGGTAVSATAAEVNRAADVSGRLVLAGSTLAVTEALHDGKTILLDQLAGSVCTLPAASGSGARFRFVVHTLATSNSHIVKVANASDIMYGFATALQDAGDTAVFFETAADSDTITLNRSTTGSTQKGEFIECEDIATNVWAVRVMVAATGTEATPFSATVA